MSYILDALQRSSAEETTDHLPTQPQATRTGLALGWQVAIGAVLATNLILLYLWQSDKSGADKSGADQGDSGRTALITQATQESEVIPAQGVTSTTPTQDSYPPRPATPDTNKKTLPGIASPRELPPPRGKNPASQQTASSGPVVSGQPLPGTAKTFRPTGAAITIAEPSLPLTQSATAPDLAADTQTLAQPAPQPSVLKEQQPETDLAEEPTTTVKEEPLRLSETTEPVDAANADVSQLYELSDGAREALYVLNFSIHIYSEDADLRAVVVNGKRLLEGNNVTTESGQSFRLVEIFDTGVVVQFEHDGVTETVEIPVNEEWKEA